MHLGWDGYKRRSTENSEVRKFKFGNMVNRRKFETSPNNTLPLKWNRKWKSRDSWTGLLIFFFIFAATISWHFWNVRLLRLVIKIVPDKFSLPKPYAYIQSVLKSCLTNQDKNSFKIIINIMQCVLNFCLNGSPWLFE